MQTPLSPNESIEFESVKQQLEKSLPKQRVTNLLGIAGDRHSYQLFLVCQMCLIGFFQAAFSNSLPYIFKTPNYMCHNEKGDTWVCDRSEACQKDQGFTLFSSVYSINLKFELVCENEYLVTQSIVLVLVISGLVSCFLFLLADCLGRKKLFFMCCGLQVIGLLAAALAQDLFFLVLALTVTFTGNYLWFSNSFVYCSEMFGGWTRITIVPLLLASCSAGSIFSHAVGPSIPSYIMQFYLYFVFFVLSSFSYVFIEETPFFNFWKGSLFSLYETLSYLISWNFKGNKKKSRTRLLNHILFDEDADLTDIHFHINRLNKNEDDIKWDLELDGINPKKYTNRQLKIKFDEDENQKIEEEKREKKDEIMLQNIENEMDESDDQILEKKQEREDESNVITPYSSKSEFSVDNTPAAYILEAAKLARVPKNAKFHYRALPPRSYDQEEEESDYKENSSWLSPSISVLLSLITIAMPIFVGDGLTTLAVQQMGVKSVSRAGIITGLLELVGDLLAFLYSPVISRKAANSISQVLIFIASSILILMDYNHQSSLNAFSSQSRFLIAEGFCCIIVRLAVSFNMGSLQTFISELFPTKHRVFAAAGIMLIGRIVFGLTQWLVEATEKLDFNSVCIMFFFSIVALPVTYLLPNSDHKGIPN